MSFLAPLYALAALAIAIPILLHLVRKQPKDRLEFSSLLFLPESPPRLTRNSKIENWLLLLLRAAVLAMLAFAFARPYWITALNANTDSTAQKRWILLMDQSASMQRDGVWAAAQSRAKEILNEAAAADAIAVYGFGDQLTPSIALAQAQEVAITGRKSLATSAIETLKPNSSSANLGLAIAGCLDHLHVDSASREDALRSKAEIVVLSDFSQGTQLDALGNLNWPSDVSVRWVPIAPHLRGNASFTILDKDAALTADQVGSPGETIVRIVNQKDATRESFRLHWIDPEGKRLSNEPVSCTVPAGASRVVRIPPPGVSVAALELEGDDCPFDNRRYLVNAPPQTLNVRVVESAARVPEESLAFFLERLPLSTPTAHVQAQRVDPGSPWPAPSPSTHPWTVLSHQSTLEDAVQARRSLDAGADVLLVLDRPKGLESQQEAAWLEHLQELTKRCTEVGWSSVREASVKEFGLLERLDFDHPVFAPLANPQFNDFSKVRFWAYRHVELPSDERWRVLAWMGPDQPAILEQEVGKGRLVVFVFGWQPLESQFALSSKFVPIMAGLLSQAVPAFVDGNGSVVGDPVPAAPDLHIEGPEHPSEPPKVAADSLRTFPMPGIYRMIDGSGAVTSIAVNLDPRESMTVPLDPSELERFGVPLSSAPLSATYQEEQHRKMIATELESTQSWWWWLVSAALVAVGLESLLCWRRDHPVTLGTAGG